MGSIANDYILIMCFLDTLILQMLQYARKKRSGSLLSTKSSFSTGYRYHEGHMLTVPSLPSPEGSKTYLFEHLVGKEGEGKFKGPKYQNIWGKIEIVFGSYFYTDFV